MPQGRQTYTRALTPWGGANGNYYNNALIRSGLVQAACAAAGRPSQASSFHTYYRSCSGVQRHQH